MIDLEGRSTGVTMGGDMRELQRKQTSGSVAAVGEGDGSQVSCERNDTIAGMHCFARVIAFRVAFCNLHCT